MREGKGLGHCLNRITTRVLLVLDGQTSRREAAAPVIHAWKVAGAATYGAIAGITTRRMPDGENAALAMHK